jgi:ribosomal subunit interface protein
MTARHLELTDGLKNHVERHLVEAVRGHTGANITRMEVQLYQVSEREPLFGCHVTLELSPRHDLNIREEDNDLYEAIDVAQKRLLVALTAYRDRLITQSRHPKKYSYDRIARALGFRRGKSP